MLSEAMKKSPLLSGIRLSGGYNDPVCILWANVRFISRVSNEGRCWMLFGGDSLEKSVLLCVSDLVTYLPVGG